MNLFDLLVTQAMKRWGKLASLRSVVEKELLHHDILREMSAAGMLNDLTFIGGTCLRACYGSHRLSEDLDFTGGVGFRCETLRCDQIRSPGSPPFDKGGPGGIRSFYLWRLFLVELISCTWCVMVIKREIIIFL
ncbi:MAG: nucleotidyl transferase AbiEii/AbiGii toxin family protein [Deltaproteobacteria bacterium]|nr:nucleotidyl transferase AbiEii/AbiGii toxin family protein [Deltaproteobacteria bacterium]